jgi:hypothetical protein
VQVVAELQRELVLAGLELHVDFSRPRAEVDPRRRALHDFRSSRQTVHVDAEVMVAHARANLLGRDGFFGAGASSFSRPNPPSQGSDRSAILRFDEEDAAPAPPVPERCSRGSFSGRLRGRFRSAACAGRNDERGEGHRLGERAKT